MFKLLVWPKLHIVFKTDNPVGFFHVYCKADHGTTFSDTLTFSAKTEHDLTLLHGFWRAHDCYSINLYIFQSDLYLEPFITSSLNTGPEMMISLAFSWAKMHKYKVTETDPSLKQLDLVLSNGSSRLKN